jgi:hypothetical protein
MARFGLLQAPLDARLLQYNEEMDALLPSHYMGSGVISIDGLPEFLRRWLPVIERIRERSVRERGGSGELGFHGGSSGGFIVYGKVELVIIPPAMVQMHRRRGPRLGRGSWRNTCQ